MSRLLLRFEWRIGIVACLLCFSAAQLRAQSLYFPPLFGSQWDTLSPEGLGWCTEEIPALYSWLDQENTKAFIVLKEGKIVLEKYFDNFTADSLWYWASAGKSLTAMAVGIAQQEGLLQISDPSSDYLGQGWTAAPPEKEALIQVRHQLTMSSGLDDGVAEPACTLDTCLQYLADAGQRWAYHNGPYTLLDQVIEEASGQNLNAFVQTRIGLKTGILGAFIKLDYDNVFFSTPRNMARYGLLVLNKGRWNQTDVLGDTSYFAQMTTSSNPFNRAYGYLWWLNGQPSFMLPGSQIVFPGPLMPSGPQDAICAEGKNGQFINVIPSQKLVLIRMGENPDFTGPVSIKLNEDLWQRLNNIICGSSAVDEGNASAQPLLFPNPVAGDRALIRVADVQAPIEWALFDPFGKCLRRGSSAEIDLRSLAPAVYCVEIRNGERSSFQKLILQ